MSLCSELFVQFPAAMTTTRMHIDNLTGSTDNAHLEKALESVPKVDSVEIDASAGEALVRHDSADLDQLVRAVAGLGYTARVE